MRSPPPFAIDLLFIGSPGCGLRKPPRWWSGSGDPHADADEPPRASA